MTDNEREILREREPNTFGERRPYDSSRQATYEDSVSGESDEAEDEQGS